MVQQFLVQPVPTSPKLFGRERPAAEDWIESLVPTVSFGGENSPQVGGFYGLVSSTMDINMGLEWPIRGPKLENNKMINLKWFKRQPIKNRAPLSVCLVEA